MQLLLHNGVTVSFPLATGADSDRYHDADEMRKVEELGVSILGSLFKFCTGERLQRLVLKFEENECEKIDRLCELFCRCDAFMRI